MDNDVDWAAPQWTLVGNILAMVSGVGGAIARARFCTAHTPGNTWH
jgi:hypothetical protein